MLSVLLITTDECVINAHKSLLVLREIYISPFLIHIIFYEHFFFQKILLKLSLKNNKLF